MIRLNIEGSPDDERAGFAARFWGSVRWFLVQEEIHHVEVLLMLALIVVATWIAATPRALAANAWIAAHAAVTGRGVWSACLFALASMPATGFVVYCAGARYERTSAEIRRAGAFAQIFAYFALAGLMASEAVGESLAASLAVVFGVGAMFSFWRLGRQLRVG